MKLKRNISQLLSIGILLNNLSFYSNASVSNTEIPNRYEILEGEYITIDDSTEGELVEIEVFGNTVQDENNLEDIQSIGDLYIDKEGNPILDSQGREQYKVDIVSGNRIPVVKDIWNTSLNKELSFSNRWSGVSFDTSGYTKPGDRVRVHLKIKKISDSHNFSNPIALTVLDSGGYNQHLITNSEWVNLPIGESIEKTIVRTIGLETGRSYLSLQVGQIGENTDPTSNTGTFIIENVELDIMLNNDTEIKENKTTILLPTQLQKVGDIADRLYWDNEKGRYIIEKNIKEYITPDIEYTGQLNIDVKFPEDMVMSDNLQDNYPFIFDGAKVKGWALGDSDKFAVKRYRNDSYIRLATSSIYTNEEISSKLSDKKVYYITENLEIIETNITSKLKIPTYEGKTHIFVETENGVNPTLKVTIDRLPQIAKNTVEEAEADSTTNNISLARMCVNMLPESIYKDQLQEQLSNIFSTDIILDRKTSTANLDIYIKSENMLSLSLNTNSVTFEDYSGVEDMEKLNAVNITINSSLPYNLNAYLPNEITNSDKSQTMPIDILHIKESSERDYQTFANNTDKIVLKDNNLKGNNNIHNIDLKLASNKAHKSDIYKTVIKFEAEQK